VRFDFPQPATKIDDTLDDIIGVFSKRSFIKRANSLSVLGMAIVVWPLARAASVSARIVVPLESAHRKRPDPSVDLALNPHWPAVNVSCARELALLHPLPKGHEGAADAVTNLGFAQEAFVGGIWGKSVVTRRGIRKTRPF
jgi:hypothetical protein